MVVFILYLQAYYEHLPINRRLDEKQKEVAKELLQLRCNKQFLQHKLATDCNKIVHRKDLANLAHSLKNADDDELDKVVKLLETDYGECDVWPFGQHVPLSHLSISNKIAVILCVKYMLFIISSITITVKNCICLLFFATIIVYFVYCLRS